MLRFRVAVLCVVASSSAATAGESPLVCFGNEHGRRSQRLPSFAIAVAPIPVVLAVNLSMTWVVLPRLDTSFLAEARWGGISLQAVSGIWSVVTALIVASVVLVLLNRRRLPELRKSLDAGANASVLLG